MLRNAVLVSIFAVCLASLANTVSAADPALAQKWVTYGNTLMTAKQYDKALQAYSTAARADSRSAAAWKGLGTVYYYKKDYPNAVKYYKYSYQLNPTDAALGAFIPKLAATAATPATSSATDYAARFYQAKRYDEAIQYYNQALATNPNDAKAWQGLGNCYYAKQDKPQAVNAYKRALQLNPGNIGLQNFLTAYAPESAGAAGAAVIAGGPKDWVQPLWRSAVLPGWGQAYEGRSTAAWVLGGATLAFLGGTVVTYIMGDAARTQYMGLTDEGEDYDTPYGTWESMANINHICFIGWQLAWAYTMIDAVMNAKPMPTQHAEFKEEAPALQLTMLGRDGGMGLKYRLLKF